MTYGTVTANFAQVGHFRILLLPLVDQAGQPDDVIYADQARSLSRGITISELPLNRDDGSQISHYLIIGRMTSIDYHSTAGVCGHFLQVRRQNVRNGGQQIFTSFWTLEIQKGAVGTFHGRTNVHADDADDEREHK
uniref:Uncharacterized protein n=1 Tax=Romanomermis culicivorax TaxID=13658 RepID=A0A915KKK3_ROMCU